VTAEDERLVRDFHARYIPALDGKVADCYTCLYTTTPDQHFLIDRHPAHPNVTYATACSGHGFKFSTVVGEILADLALTGHTLPAADFLRAARLGIAAVMTVGSEP
jgi:sarcosine oxidase